MADCPKGGKHGWLRYSNKTAKCIKCDEVMSKERAQEYFRFVPHHFGPKPDGIADRALRGRGPRAR